MSSLDFKSSLACGGCKPPAAAASRIALDRWRGRPPPHTDTEYAERARQNKERTAQQTGHGMVRYEKWGKLNELHSLRTAKSIFDDATKLQNDG